MRREMTRGEHLVQLYTLARRIVPQLDISREGITYYSSLVSYYSVFRLKRLDTWIIYLYLLCFVVHRYQRFNDNLLTCAHSSGEAVLRRSESHSQKNGV
jgi:hypothetical protein